MEDLYDLLDFEARDEIDAEREQNVEHMREALTGLPARPGVIR